MTPVIKSLVKTRLGIMYRWCQQHRQCNNCNKISLPAPQSDHEVKNNYMSENSNPTAPQQNMKKLPLSKILFMHPQ
jgi:hypothetical protein